MSDVVYADFDNYDLENFDFSKKKYDKDRKVGILKIIVAVIAILIMMQILMYLLFIPCFSKPVVIYSGIENLNQTELNKSIEKMINSPWIKFNASEATSKLLSQSSIENVTITKTFPDKINIQISERKAVAKTLMNVDGCSVPVQIDKNGVLFSNGTSKITDSSIPLISGLPVENLTEGMRLPSKYRALMAEISDIKSLPQKYFAALSEIQVVSKEYGNYELVLYPVKTHVKVLTDRSLTEDALKYMMVVLDVVNSIEPNVAEVDLRYGSVSYVTRWIWKDFLDFAEILIYKF